METFGLSNMDQTPLEFCFNTKGATYADTGGENGVVQNN